MNEQFEYEFHTDPNQSPFVAPQKPRKNRLGLKITALALCCSLLGGAMGAGGIILYQNSLEQSDVKATAIYTSDREVTPVAMTTVKAGEAKTAAQVYAENVNSTVGITTSITTNFWGYTTTSAASGSGFILTKDGYVLTNYHVIENSDSITVTSYDGTAYDAQLIGYDESLDTAILKIEPDTELTPVVLGNSDALNVGDSVIAIGNPLGELTFSLTAGAVSALDRKVTMSSSVTMDLIQTDCAINSGNSGGALFNLYGEVVGITNAKYSSSSSSEASIDNIGFAIPINDVVPIITSILEKGYIAKPYIGVSITDVSQETQSYGLPQGAAVKEVAEGSPAEAAGLQVNDIIVKANDTEITGKSELVDFIGACSVGDQISLTVYRQGETLELSLEIGEQIQSALANEQEAQQSQQSQPQQGYGYGSFPFFGFGG